MKKKQYIIILTIFLLSNVELNAQQITDNAEISIVTCAPGNEVYSVFGHTAIRIKDQSIRLDNVYNYGTFNFETPSFHMKFARGKLDYMLNVTPYKYFVISYMNENRWIKEQVLNLTLIQKKEIFIFLQNNALPENMYYRYDFFYDNCATRVKDVIKNVLSEDMISAESVTKEGNTFRDMIEPYLQGRNWDRFGINLALGQPADKIVTADEATFLPDYTEIFFDNSFVIINGKTLPAVKDKRMLYEPKVKHDEKKSFITPSLIFWIIFVLFLFLSAYEFKSGKYFYNFDKTLFFIIGFTGLAILLLWFATDHKAVVNNSNIIWAMPLLLPAAFILKKESNHSYFRIFLLAWSFLLFISLITEFTFYNLFDKAVIPIILILLVRSQLIFFLRK